MTDAGKGLAIASLICGIVGLISAWFFGIGAIIGIVAIILAVISGNKSQASGFKRSALAIVGLILGIVAVVSGSGCLLCTVCSCISGGADALSELGSYGY